jgi:hypothetical protein
VQSRVRVLRELISNSMYVVDERSVADAVVLRSRLRMTVADGSFRSEHRGPPVRSFRRDPGARSFRLSRDARLRQVHH